MFDIISQMQRWHGQQGKRPLYAATVIGIEGSAVRGPGATLGIAADCSLAGSVSGGCIESTVIQAVEGLRKRGAAELLTFCPSDDPFIGAPAPCGGTVEVCIYPYSVEVARAVEERMEAGLQGAWGVVIGGSSGQRGMSFALDRDESLVLSRDVDTAFSLRLSEFLSMAPEDGGVIDEGKTRIFIQRIPVVPHALVIGGSHIGEVLVSILKRLLWKVTVIDPRTAFAPAERFTAADEVLNVWPEEAGEILKLNTREDEKKPRPLAVAAVTHNEQIDDFGVAMGLNCGAFYVGVLGSTRTFGSRLERLKTKGFTAEDLNRVHGPIGIDIGAESPEEIGLAIAAEMVQDYRNIAKR